MWAWWPVWVTRGQGGEGLWSWECDTFVRNSDSNVKKFGLKNTPCPISHNLIQTICHRMDVRLQSKLKWSKDLTTEMFAQVTHLCTLWNIFMGMKPLRSSSVMMEKSWCPVTRGYCCHMYTCHYFGVKSFHTQTQTPAWCSSSLELGDSPCCHVTEGGMLW